MSRQTFITSWVGFEHVRQQLQTLAHEVLATDTLVRQNYDSSIATGLICSAMMNKPQLVNDELVVRAAAAQNALYALHHKCVWEHNIDFDLAYNVWGPILDPNCKLIPVTGTGR